MADLKIKVRSDNLRSVKFWPNSDKKVVLNVRKIKRTLRSGKKSVVEEQRDDYDRDVTWVKFWFSELFEVTTAFLCYPFQLK